MNLPSIILPVNPIHNRIVELSIENPTNSIIFACIILLLVVVVIGITVFTNKKENN